MQKLQEVKVKILFPLQVITYCLCLEQIVKSCATLIATLVMLVNAPS